MTNQNSAPRAPNKEIREAFELTYAADADDPACAADLFHFTNGWRACIMSKLRAPVADETPLENVADAAIKAAYVQHFGNDSGWLGLPGSYFIEGHRVGRQAAQAASAPVAGEAQPAAYLTLDEEGSPCMLFFDVVEARGYCEVGEEPVPLFRHAAPQASAEPVRILFPAHLRKMWSGGEVQAWLDQHQGVTPPPATAKGSLARYQQWRAEQAQATDKDHA